jgi:hypothetical protein
MKLESTTVTFAIWLLAMCAVGLTVDITSVAGWTVLGGLALLPPVFMLRMQRERTPTVSEAINEARR